uniref:Uncharacterized protein n=1 Tax=Quercus lobata TaxID=97700 RepID=A0A7N2L723_QUELO
MDQRDNESMKNFISHYLYYLDIIGVDQEEARSPEFREVVEEVNEMGFNPSKMKFACSTCVASYERIDIGFVVEIAKV